MEHITAVPFSMKQYIDQKMSSNIYSKLICTNKCIFAYYRMIVIDDLQFTVDKEDYMHWEYDDDSNQLSNPWIKPSIMINLNENKLWITKRLCASSKTIVTPFSYILKHICRNNISQLVLYNDQIITKSELSIIASSLTELTLGNVHDDYGNPLAIGEVLSMTPKLEEFWWGASFNSPPIHLSLLPETSSQLPYLPNLKYFTVNHIADCNVKTIHRFMKNHTQTKFNFHFSSVERYEAFKSLAMEEFKNAKPQYDGSLRITCRNRETNANADTLFYIY